MQCYVAVSTACVHKIFHYKLNFAQALNFSFYFNEI